VLERNEEHSDNEAVTDDVATQELTGYREMSEVKAYKNGMVALRYEVRSHADPLS
jgi:hypothetical protein